MKSKCIFRLLLVFGVAVPAWLPVQAHEIPDDVIVRVVVIPQAEIVEVAMRDRKSVV